MTTAKEVHGFELEENEPNLLATPEKVPEPPTIFYIGKNARQFLTFHDPRIANLPTSKKIYLYLYHFLKFVISTVGSLVFWVGMWDLFETYWFPFVLETEYILLCSGFLGYFIIIAIYKIPFLDALEHSKGWVGFIARNVRDSLAAVCCVSIWKGAYNLFDIYVWEASWFRSSIYAAVGFVIMVLCDGLKNNTQF